MNRKHCGGTVVDPKVVLTAAHCFTDQETGSFQSDGTDYRVTFNRYERKDDTGTDYRPVNNKEEGKGRNYIQRHPEYNSTTYDNDVAIICLNSPVNDTIKPVKLNDDDNIPETGEEFQVMGWGYTDASNTNNTKKLSNIPQIATVDYITNEACTKDPYKYTDGRITDNMMCAAAEDKDSCKGDSGIMLLLIVSY